jgi:hypothetical protein
MIPDNVEPDTASPEDVERMWDLITRRGAPPSVLHRVQFTLACPDGMTAQFLAQYLGRSADFTSTPASPRVSDDGHEYWSLEATSSEGPLSLNFLRQVCATVRTAAARLGCRVRAYQGRPPRGQGAA